MKQSALRGTSSPLSTASISDVEYTVNFVRETLWGERVAVITTAPLAPWMIYIWEVEEDNDAAEKGRWDEEEEEEEEKEDFCR